MKQVQFLKLFLLAFVLSSIFACKKKEEDAIGTPVYPDIAEIIADPGGTAKRLMSKAGYIHLSVYTPIGLDGGYPNIYATFDKQDYFGALSVGSYELSYDPAVKAYDNSLDHSSATYLRTLFGTQVPIQLKDKNGTKDEMIHKIYVPKQLKVTTSFTSDISTNAKFAWNADVTNTLGVFILITFEPSDPHNKAFSNVPAVAKQIRATDNGSYSLTAQDLAGIPKGASIRITLARGNFAETKGLTTSDDYLVYVNSIATGAYVVE
jgi:hypothetical protein